MSTNKKRRLEDVLKYKKTTVESKKKGKAAACRPTSYGILLYKVDEAADHSGTEIRFLLGLIPQRNFWTVFKGMPNSPEETPQETALREFQEETGTEGLLELSDDLVLQGTTGKKDLVIFLQEGSHVSTTCFQKDRVVKIDQGYMKGHPEIVAIRWLTFEQAMEGIPVCENKTARIYNSQQQILKEAHEFIQSNLTSSITEKKSKEAS